jgi:hypothetical protein
MKRLLTLFALSLSLAGCAGQVAKFEQVYTLATTTTVPADVVRPAANTFDILKGTASNFADWCIARKFQSPGCDEATRRKIVLAVKSGTNARIQTRAALATNQPVLSTVYNLLVTAVSDLQKTPVATFTGG